MAFYNGTVGGFLSGAAPTYPNTNNQSAVLTPGTYGNATNVSQIVVGTGGQISSIGNVAISGVPGTITTKDEGTTLSTAVTTLNFVGAGVTATGAGATTLVTIPSYTPTGGTSPAHSYMARQTYADVTAVPTIFTFNNGGATVISSQAAIVQLTGNWYGSGMNTASISGFVSMSFEFAVSWTVASNPTMTLAVNMPNLWTALSMSLAWNGASQTGWTRGKVPMVQNNINIVNFVDVSYPDANTLQFGWNTGAASLSQVFHCEILINVGGALA